MDFTLNDKLRYATVALFLILPLVGAPSNIPRFIPLFWVLNSCSNLFSIRSVSDILSSGQDFGILLMLVFSVWPFNPKNPLWSKGRILLGLTSVFIVISIAASQYYLSIYFWTVGVILYGVLIGAVVTAVNR